MTFDLDIWHTGVPLPYRSSSKVKVIGQISVRGYRMKMFCFGYGCTLRGDVYILNRSSEGSTKRAHNT